MRATLIFTLKKMCSYGGSKRPSCFWLSIAIIAIVAFINEQKPSLLLQAISFSRLGYSSIRLVPGELFTRNLSLLTLFEAKAEYRQSDVLIQSCGILLLLVSLVLGHIIGI